MLRFDHSNDPVIRISSYTNNLIALAVPVILVIVLGGFRNSLHELHHGLLAAVSGRFVVSHDEMLSLITNHLQRLESCDHGGPEEPRR